MIKYSEGELKRLESLIMHKTAEIDKEKLTIKQNQKKVDELKKLGAEEILYENESRECVGAEARINRWKELLEADFKDVVKLLNLKIEELTVKSKQMSSYIGRTPLSRKIDIEAKENENSELDKQIKEIEENKQKKLKLMQNYQNLGDDERVDEIKEKLKIFEKEIDMLKGKKEENQKIIDLNNSKLDDVIIILNEIAEAKSDIQDVRQLAEEYGIKLDIKEETKPKETKPEETKPEETKPEETKPEETKPEETKPEETKPEETKPEETKPEETKPEETKPEETKPEETKPEETKNEPILTQGGATKIMNITEIRVFPEEIIIVGSDFSGKETAKRVSISDDKVEEILESYNFKEGTEEYERVDPNIVKALSSNSRQLIAYLKCCNIKGKDKFSEISELSTELPEIHYDLRDIRKIKDMDFAEKDYMYQQAKKTMKMFDGMEDMCTLEIGVLDRLNLFTGRTMNKIKFNLMSLKGKVLQALPATKKTKNQKLLNAINDNLKDKHSNFIETIKVDTTQENDMKSLTPEQKALLDAETKKFILSDGDVRDKE